MVVKLVAVLTKANIHITALTHECVEHFTHCSHKRNTFDTCFEDILCHFSVVFCLESTALTWGDVLLVAVRLKVDSHAIGRLLLVQYSGRTLEKEPILG